MGSPPAPRRLHYGKLPGLKDVYLEDSYVLSVAEDQALFRMTLLAVLRESHPSFVAPGSQDRYCFKLAVLEFRAVERLEWKRRSMTRYRDADGRVDYGNIDVFYREVDGAYHLEGDWGVVDIGSAPPVITLVQ